MKAIILAAGQSSRLYPLTKETPKCLLELERGTSIIDIQISMIKQLGIHDIVIVTGFKSIFRPFQVPSLSISLINIRSLSSALHKEFLAISL